jgi:DNA invertase Pin-like site-specific DNA recombinase
MASGKFVAYVRVSTGKQGRSGLGLEAQRSAIGNYLNGGPWELLKEFQEVESGKNDERLELNQALHLCQLTGATLLIAKLDRLSRDLHFITSLQKAGIDFVACDMPSATPFTIHIYAALAQQERQFISERTKAALDAARERGVKLGKPDNATPEGRLKGSQKASEVHREKADRYAANVLPVILQCKADGESLRQIAETLNGRNILTSRGYNEQGERIPWTAMKVKAVLDRSQKTQC